MEFIKYPSIENSYRSKFIDRIREMEIDQLSWVVKEKIHGANFAFYVDLNTLEIKCAKRSAFLQPEEGFYNYQQVLERLKYNLINLASDIKVNYQSDTSLSHIIVWGELFGGTYSHKEVKRLHYSKVQSGVQYTNQIEFLAFDLAINNKLTSQAFAYSFFRMFKIPHVPILKTGTLDECLKYPNKFTTKVPNLYELPEIENNFCEGVVIVPNTPFFDHQGNRMALKNKNEAFKEVKPTNKKPKFVNTQTQNLASMYINENRLQNVLSKLGEVSIKDFGLINSSLCNDALEDIIKDHPNIEIKPIKKALGQLSAKLVSATLKKL